MGSHDDRGIRRPRRTRMMRREQAAALVRRYDGLRPDVVALATVVSPAVRVDPGLLRRARIDLTQGVTVASEADLWFSALVSSRTVRGFVLDAAVAAVLQARLAADGGLLAACEELIRDVHRDAPPTIRLEENLRFAALRKDDAEVDRLMQGALLTIAREPTRGPGIARWAHRALAELPPAASQAPSAGYLAAATEKFLKAPVEVGVQLTRKGIVVSEPPEEGAHVLALPPEPLRLEVRHEGARDPVTVDVMRGDVVTHKLGDAVTAVELHTADGQVARLRPLTATRREPGLSTGMMKRVILCCDGTWNQPDRVDQGVAAHTNVAKIALGLSDFDDHGNAQVLHYSAGVGERRGAQLLMGAGLSRSVQECYRFLVDNYEPGNELYFFGFSRGAFVARSTVGLIRNCGILRREHRDRVEEAYRIYRSRDRATSPQEATAETFRRSYAHPDMFIQFVGLWETVGPLGIPNDPVRPSLLTRRWALHDTSLSRYVRHAYHALAIDERRTGFEPALWHQHEDVPEQALEQVWFSGAHCDVGGGYRDSSLSDIALLWMADRARACGLTFKPDRLMLGDDVAPDPFGALHDSRGGAYRVLPAVDRKLEADGGAVASSAVSRMERDRTYRPPELVRYLGAAGRVTEVGEAPKARASGLSPPR